MYQSIVTVAPYLLILYYVTLFLHKMKNDDDDERRDDHKIMYEVKKIKQKHTYNTHIIC